MSIVVKIIFMVLTLVGSFFSLIAGFAVISGTDGTQGVGYMVVGLVLFLLFLGILILSVIDAFKAKKSGQPETAVADESSKISRKSPIGAIVLIIFLLIVALLLIWAFRSTFLSHIEFNF